MPIEQAPGSAAERTARIEDLALAAFESMSAAVFVTDATGTIQWVNPAFTELTGWPAKDAVGQNPRILRSGLQDREYYEAFWATIGAGQQIKTHVINKTRGGQLYSAVQTVTPLCSDDGHPHYFVAVQETVASHEIPIFDELPVAVVSTDCQGRVRVWNRAAERLLGWEAAELRGRLFDECVLAEEARPAFAAAMGQACDGVPWEQELRVRKLNGSVFSARVQVAAQADMDGRVTGLAAAIVDISEEIRLREALARVERLEATGRLAASVAHDVNNNLTAIALHARVAASSLAANHPVNDDLHQIEIASARTAALARQLLVFSKKQILRPAAVKLNDVLDNLMGLLRHAIREDIELDYRPGDDLDPVWVDPGQVEQAIVNLVVNARDAMPNGGVVRLATSMTTCQSGERFGVIEVSDSGTGITPEVLEHLYEPFFTTKGDAGTGLGLATVHGVVTQSGGHVSVASTVGQGTTFRVAFPVAISRHAPVPAVEPQPVARASASGTVLIVDDDIAIREVVRRILAAEGYQAIAAGSAAEALVIADERRNDLALVISDVRMPELTGPDMVQALARDGVHAPTIFMSGYADEPGQLASPSSHFLAKPFTSSELKEVVDRVLGAPAAFEAANESVAVVPLVTVRSRSVA